MRKPTPSDILQTIVLLLMAAVAIYAILHPRPEQNRFGGMVVLDMQKEIESLPLPPGIVRLKAQDDFASQNVKAHFQATYTLGNGTQLDFERALLDNHWAFIARHDETVREINIFCKNDIYLDVWPGRSGYLRVFMHWARTDAPHCAEKF